MPRPKKNSLVVKEYNPKGTPDKQIFGDIMSELPLRKDKAERNLEAELFSGKKMNEIIDEFEKNLGFQQPTPPKANIKYRNIVLTPEDANDRATLNELMNDKEKYQIIKWSEAWTARSQYKVFIVFTEIMPEDPAAVKKEIKPV